MKVVRLIHGVTRRDRLRNADSFVQRTPDPPAEQKDQINTDQILPPCQKKRQPFNTNGRKLCGGGYKTHR